MNNTIYAGATEQKPSYINQSSNFKNYIPTVNSPISTNITYLTVYPYLILAKHYDYFQSKS